jgi:hypothetical protein
VVLGRGMPVDPSAASATSHGFFNLVKMYVH